MNTIKKISLLKVDIEVSEEVLFSENLEWTNKFDIIYCEIHENLKAEIKEKVKEVFVTNIETSGHGGYHVYVSKLITC